MSRLAAGTRTRNRTRYSGGAGHDPLRCGTSFVTGAAIAVLLAGANASWSQDALTAKLHPSGMVQISRADVGLATIELNAHGPGWKHAPQKSATADVSDLPERAGKRFVGVLAIPDTEGGAIRYTENVTTLSQGLRLEYQLTMAGTMRLNGLQFSINLPVAQYAGREVLISRVHEEPKLAGFPQEQQEGKFQVWSGQGARIEVAKGTEEAVTLELRAATDVVVQDMRKWDNPVFEIRFPAIMEDAGREVSAGDRFHLDLTVTFAAPVRLEGP